MSGYPTKISIEELCIRVSSGGTPSRKVQEYWEGGTIPWVKTGELKDSKIFDAEEKITIAGLENSSAKKLPENTILMAMYGDGKTITSLGILQSELATNQACCAMLAAPEKCDYRFLYYSLMQNRRRLLGLVVAGAQRNLSIGIIKRFEIDYFPLKTQIVIGNILSSYDDLIENNKRRIALLEESARQLYKEWFVRFRFPGHEHARIVDGVPEGWAKGCVGNFSKVLSGFAFKSRDWIDEGNPVIKIKNISSANTIHTENCQCVDDSVAEKAAKFELRAGDMLIAMTGATVGKVGILPPSSKRFYLNQRVGKFTSLIGRDVTPFLLSFFNSDSAQASISNLAGGAAQPNISAKQIESIPCPCPPFKMLHSFLDQTESSFSLRLNLIDQNNKLVRARNLLLPKLMSGELTV
ncbi:restriction endonuclease subunit S [Aliidiomarina indica]|uniref:restriction endonuclease subunit S n=1 Tax=Aliidiomarina indica TaxID=2749147 RepID=UPI00188F07B2|nr:restriction endonuclease subunit S [Aliidiomarina indica]